mgnify:CR=1 FL=1
MLFRSRGGFELRLDGLSAFGGRKPRALVASAAPQQAMMELQAEHERLLQRVGLEPEGRKFAPHVTLARARLSKLGVRTTATMMWGCGETIEHRIHHLQVLRELQEETGGFTAFIPWSFQRDNTSLGRFIKEEATSVEFLKTLDEPARIKEPKVP